MAEYIEREALIKKIGDILNTAPMIYAGGLSLALTSVRSAPAADVKPVRHGRWNEESPDCLDGDSVYVCSVCGETWTLIEGTPLDNNMHFCPNCGAKMDGDTG